MGVSTNAMLFYGILIEDDSPLHDKIASFEEGDEEEMKENPLGYIAFMGEDLDGCEIQLHCSNEYPMYAVVVMGSCTTARRGDPKQLSTDALVLLHGWDETLRVFCEKYGVPWSEPRWCLASYWG